MANKTENVVLLTGTINDIWDGSFYYCSKEDNQEAASKVWEVSNCSKNGVTCGQKAGAAEMNHIQSCQFLKAETIIGHMNSILTKI